MNRAKILIVDNQQINIERLKAHLKEYAISEVNSGRLALRKVSEEKPDVILLDAMMTGIDGLTILSILKNTPETKSIPVLLFATSEEIESLSTSSIKSADDFLIMPFNPIELQSKVKSLVTIKGLQDELADVQRLLISFAEMVENKTEYFVGHGQRTAGYAIRLARKELVQPALLEGIRIAALLHDIGMINVPETLLVKPSHLTEAEYEKVKMHPIASEKICSVLIMLRPILPYVRSHHERYDGNGYPDGLKGQKIPLGARIIAVADAYDALTCTRPSRRSYTPDEAIYILKQGAGIHWDPGLVELFSQTVDIGV